MNNMLDAGVKWDKKKGVEKNLSRESAGEDDMKNLGALKKGRKEKEVFKSQTQMKSAPPLGDGKYSSNNKYKNKAEKEEIGLFLSMNVKSGQGGYGRRDDSG